MVTKVSKKVRVALYLRVSTHEQVEGFSFDVQENDLLSHIKRNSYKGWETGKDLIFKEAESGGNFNRKQLQRMLEMAKKKKFDMVMVWKIDRISRSLADLLTIFEQLNKNGISFASFKEDIDFSGPIGRLIFQIFGALSEFERETIKMRTEEGKKMSASKGNYIGGSEPYGFEKVKNSDGRGSKLKVIPSEAKIVKQIFQWFVFKRWNFADIAEQLNKSGTPKAKTARGKAKITRWRAEGIKKILSNEIYRGAYITNRFQIVSKKPERTIERPRNEWTITTIDHIVDSILYMQSQERLHEGLRPKRGGGKETYMFAGKLIDMETGKGFVGYIASKETKNYRRKKFIDPHTQKIFKTISIAETPIENSVWPHIEKAAYKPELFLKLYREKSDLFKNQKVYEQDFELYEKAYSKANERLEILQTGYFDGRFTAQRFDELKLKFESERDQNFLKMKEAEDQLKKIAQFDLTVKDLERFSQSVKEGLANVTYEQKKMIVNILVEKIEIHQEKDQRKVRVFLRFDQKAIASAMPQGRTQFWLQEENILFPRRQVFMNGGQRGIRTPEGVSHQIYSLTSLAA